jgi:Thioredoxin
MAYLNLSLVIAVLVGCGGRDPASPPPAEPTPAAEVEQIYDLIPQDGVRLGARDAPATLIEFADLQCPFCGRFSREVMPTVVGGYVAQRRIAFELHIRGVPRSRLGAGGGRGRGRSGCRSRSARRARPTSTCAAGTS